MKVLIIDDHVLIRDALGGVLRSIDADAVIVAASDGKEGSSLTAQHGDFTLAIVDIQLPDCSGIDVLIGLRRQFPVLPIIIVSAYSDRGTVVEALDAGASGFIPKSATRDVLLTAMKLVLAGGVYIPQTILDREDQLTAGARVGQEHRRPTSPDELGLTDRQLDVLGLMMRGKSNKLICRALSLAEPTVKNHVSAILKALGVSNRTEAVLMAKEFGWDLPASPMNNQEKATSLMRVPSQ